MVGEKNEDVPSFGLARCGCIRRKTQRASEKPPGIEDVTTFVGHSIAVVLVCEDDLQNWAPKSRFMKVLRQK